MRFMSIITTPPSAQQTEPTPGLIEAMGKLTERETAAGRMIASGGLEPLDKGVRVTIRDGRVGVHDGPFTEAKEVIGGYAIFELASLQEAVALAVEFMELHREHLPGWDGTLEVRALSTEGCG